MNELKYWGRVGRDGKGRYCIYYITRNASGALKRVVVGGGLTKLAARQMLKLAKED